MQNPNNQSETQSLPELPTFPFSSNSIRLYGREWMICIVLFVVVYLYLPEIWKQLEPLPNDADYRIPYSLSEDYWFFNRLCRERAVNDAIGVLGDSVVWGEYVTPDQTLSHYLSAAEGKSRLVNLGVNGIHPAALCGLITYYGQPITNRKILLPINPLWMSSPRHDLQIEKEFHFNHPKLVNQFYPKIPCYRAAFTERLGIAVERNLMFLSWVNHLRIAYFDGLDIPAWTLEHPYANPSRQIRPDIYKLNYSFRHKSIPWYESGITPQDFPWVDLSTSIQWKSMLQIMQVLQERGNRLFIFVGPFNEHLLTESSRKTYTQLKTDIENRLKEHHYNYMIPDALPSQLYGDASHPLNEGYQLLADRFFQNADFQKWLEG